MKINELKFVRLAIVVALLIGGCTTTTKTTSIPKPEPSVIVIQEPVSIPATIIPDEERIIAVPAPKRKKHRPRPVVQGLLDKAQLKLDVKAFSAAESFIERGISIAPSNPLLWQRLAVIRFQQKNYRQAKQLAVKSNILAEGDDELRMMNEKIIRRSNRFLAPR